jgi:hypothetical protein
MKIIQTLLIVFLLGSGVATAQTAGITTIPGGNETPDFTHAIPMPLPNATDVTKCIECQPVPTIDIDRAMHFSYKDSYLIQVRIPKEWQTQLKLNEDLNLNLPMTLTIKGANLDTITNSNLAYVPFLAHYPINNLTGFTVSIIDEFKVLNHAAAQQFLVDNIAFFPILPNGNTDPTDYVVNLNPSLHTINEILSKSTGEQYLVFAFEGIADQLSTGQVRASGIELELKINKH